MDVDVDDGCGLEVHVKGRNWRGGSDDEKPVGCFYCGMLGSKYRRELHGVDGHGGGLLVR
jgi:hypothetical protein